jgi:hypothetical protein
VTVSIFSASSEDERRHRSNSTISARVPPILVLLRNPAVLPGPPNFFRQVYVHEANLAVIERAGLFLGNSPSALARRMGAALVTPWQATTPGVYNHPEYYERIQEGGKTNPLFSYQEEHYIY